MKDKFKSILVIVIGLLIISLIFKNQTIHHIGLSLGVICLASSRISDFILWMWYKIAQVLGWVNSKILLTIVFYIFLFPISLLSKVFSKNNSYIKSNRTDTMFIERNHLFSKDDFENVW